MRRALVFVIALAMVAGGLYLGIAQLFFSRLVVVWVVLASGMMIGIGAWLYEDFIEPMISRKPDS